MQTLAVWLIVLLAAIYVGRRYFRALRGKNTGCDDCGSCAGGCERENGRCPLPGDTGDGNDKK